MGSRAIHGLVALVALLAASAATGRGVGEWVVQDPGAARIVEKWGTARCQAGGEPAQPWVACRTRGDGRPAFLASAAPITPGADLTGHTLRTWIRVSNLAHLSGLELRLTSSRFDEGTAAFPIPLFSDAPFNVVQPGTWTPVSFSLGTARVEGAVDLQNVRAVGLYFADRGQGGVEVAWTGLTAVQRASEGFLSFTFDDGTDDHATIAAPAMHAHGFRGTAYVMPAQVGEEGFVTAKQLEGLGGRYGWDVAAHHATPFTEMSELELEREIQDVQGYLRGRGFRADGHLAYPLGRQEPRVVRPIVRKHFATARVAGAGPETIPVADRHLLRAVNVLDTTTPAEIGAIARRAKEHGEWAILMFHVLNGDPRIEIEYAVDDFEKALVEIERSGVTVLPVSEVWERIQGIRLVRQAGRPGSSPARAAPRAPASARPRR